MNEKTTKILRSYNYLCPNLNKQIQFNYVITDTENIKVLLKEICLVIESLPQSLSTNEDFIIFEDLVKITKALMNQSAKCFVPPQLYPFIYVSNLYHSKSNDQVKALLENRVLTVDMYDKDTEKVLRKAKQLIKTKLQYGDVSCTLYEFLPIFLDQMISNLLKCK